VGSFPTSRSKSASVARRPGNPANTGAAADSSSRARAARSDRMPMPGASSAYVAAPNSSTDANAMSWRTLMMSARPAPAMPITKITSRIT
jgi:hypothetical protein